MMLIELFAFWRQVCAHLIHKQLTEQVGHHL